MRYWGRLALILLFASLSGPASANDQSKAALLAKPDHVLLIRHALAPGSGDPANFDVNDCATQRNLDARGRAQAKQIGAWLRTRDLVPKTIWSSPWCRCKDTASEMGLADVKTHPGLESFYENRAIEGRVMADFDRLISDIREQNSAPNIIVTHYVVVSAATGAGVGSGEGVIAKIEDDGSLTAITRIDFDAQVY